MPLVAFGAGLAFFPQQWRSSKLADQKICHINTDVVSEIEKCDQYKQLNNDKSFHKYCKSTIFPEQHHHNYVGSGLLFGPDLFEIDPIVFLNNSTGELVSFYHLGDKLISQDGKIHNGVISTILDEGLCSAGFPLLPSKRGVTAKLSIDFKNQAPPNSTIILKAKVLESKGRKVVIEGELSTLPLKPDEQPILIAKSNCILVEPKWFKYFSWLQIA